MKKQVREDLTKALGVLRRRGLIKDVFEEEKGGPVCARGAILRAIHPNEKLGEGDHWDFYWNSPRCVEAEKAVIKANPVIEKDFDSNLGAWNNEEERTKAQVMEAFTKTLKRR
jgi:hypothetical protein